MTLSEFIEFRDRIFALHQRSEFRAALDSVIAERGRFPEELNSLIFWQACFHSLLGEPDAAQRTLRDGLAAGEWWHPSLLQNDPDLASLQNLKEFQRLLEMCEQRFEAAQKDWPPELIEFLPPSGPTPPLPCLMALHGMGSRATLDAPHWQPAAEHGWLVALPQSSQLFSPSRFHWTDRPRAVSEIRGHYQGLCDEGRISPDQSVLAGFSQGGALAIKLALGQEVACRGFIAVAPGSDPLESLEPLVDTARQAGLRGYLITGGKDSRRDYFKSLHEWLNSHGIPCQIEWHPEMGHTFPADMRASLLTALAFIVNASSTGETT
ncbi:MAG: dienelactone hydrolase family protein [Chloroflexi bacterium]|nr:dienelactone hydrolase family protein [Chloroflexota bacterium]